MRFLLPLLLAAFTGHAAFFDQWDREAYSWRNSIVTNSGTLSGSSYNTGTRFMQHVRQFGLRPAIVNCGVYLGNETNAIWITIIHDLGSVKVVDHNFVSGDYTEATGLTGNTTTKYLTTGADMTTIGSFAHLSVYVRTASNENAAQIGAQDATPGAYLLVGYVDANTYARINGGVAAQFSAADSAGIGYYIGSRTATNAQAIYKNGLLLASSTTADTADTAPEDIMVHALNSSGSQTLFTAKTLSFWSIGGALNNNQAGALSSAVLRIQYDKKRKV
jgi:hypothetical protein